MLGKDPTVIVSWFCPFAQRTWIAIQAKKVKHRLYEISFDDLYNKPAWFLELNPDGLIPVIAWQDESAKHMITESLICNEYLEDAYPDEPRLLPTNPVERARARYIIDRFATKFVPEFYRILVRQGKEQQENSAQALDR